MKTITHFNLNDVVTLTEGSPYYADQCKGMVGKITRLPIIDEEKDWYEIEWQNGSGNVYEPHDIIKLSFEWDK